MFRVRAGVGLAKFQAGFPVGDPEARFQWRRSLSLEPEDDLLTVLKDKIKAGLGDAAPRKSGSDG